MAPATRTKDSAPSPDQQAPSLTLDVSNFGPIAEGRVDLRPLTVFAGPSNTGKSWMATLIYAMRRMFVMRSRSDWPFFYQHGSKILEMWFSEIGLSKFPENLDSWHKRIREGKDIRLNAKESDLLNKFWVFPLSEVMSEMFRCYRLSSRELIRKTSKGSTEIEMQIGKTKNRLNFHKRGETITARSGLPNTLSLKSTIDLSACIENCITTSHILESVKPSDKLIAERYHEESTFDLIREIMKNLYGSNFFDNAFYLPADRGGIMRNQELLVRNLIRDASQNGDHLKNLIQSASQNDDNLKTFIEGVSQNGDNFDGTPSITGIFADFLEKIPGLKETSPDMAETKLGSLSKKLEKNILHGSVKVRKSAAGYPTLSYQPVDWKETLSFKNVSSMVAELAPVSLYLQQIVKPGDLLILEEPETSLHPEMQQEFIREIASWVDAGLKVVLTTHSDWVINELSNIVARNQLSEIALKKKSKLPRLSQDKIGIYVFNHIDKNKPTKGSEIEEMEWKPDKGGYDTGFYKVAMNQHNEWADTMNAVADQRVSEKEKSGSDK